MIPLRRHVITIVAIFLALALGVVLGATSVATSVRDALSSDSDRTVSELGRTTDDLNSARRDVRRLDGMAATAAPALTAGTLDKRPVLVLLAPGAPVELADRAVDAVKAAGGYESGRVTVTDKVTDPAADTELQALVTNLPLGAGAPAADADPGVQLGAALAQGALLRPNDARPLLEDKDRDTVLTTLRRSGMIAYEPGTVRPGQLVLLVSGDDPGDQGFAARRIAAVARETDRVGAGTVLAEQISGAEAAGPLSVLRAGGAGVSTVDNLDSDSGRLAVVLALAEQLRSRDGHYGLLADARAAIPDPPTRG